MPETCQTCPDKTRDFGGCRCQAFMLTGDASNADPVCGKSAYHHLIEQARIESAEPNKMDRLVFRNPKNSKTFSFKQKIPSKMIND